MSKVDIVLSHPLPAWADPNGNGKGHEVGAKLSVDEDTARRLISGGTAVPATKSDAEASRVEAAPATQRK